MREKERGRYSINYIRHKRKVASAWYSMWPWNTDEKKIFLMCVSVNVWRMGVYEWYTVQVKQRLLQKWNAQPEQQNMKPISDIPLTAVQIWINISRKSNTSQQGPRRPARSLSNHTQARRNCHIKAAKPASPVQSHSRDETNNDRESNDYVDM